MELDGASDEMLTASAPPVLRRVVEKRERERERKRKEEEGTREKSENARQREDERREGWPADGGQGVGNCANNHATLQRYGPLLAL